MEDNRSKSYRGFKIFILFLLIGIIFFLNRDNQVKFIDAYRSLTIRDKTLEKIKSIDLDRTSQRMGLMDKNISIFDDSKLTIIDLEGNLILEKDFNFTSPDLVFGDDSYYVMDKSTGDIYISNKKGETIERVSLGNSIFNLVEEDDNIIVHTKSDEEESIVILDNKGVFLRVHLVEDMDILTYNIDKNKDRYLISNLIIKDEVKSQVYTYSIAGELLSSSHIDNEIIIFTKFVKDDLIALTDKCLYYMRDNKIYWKKPLSKIKDILVYNDQIYLLDSDNLEIVNLEGRTMEKFILKEGFSKLINHDDLILVWGDYDLLGVQGGKEILSYRHDLPIKDLVINKYHLALVDNDSIHLFNIRNR